MRHNICHAVPRPWPPYSICAARQGCHFSETPLCPVLHVQLWLVLHQVLGTTLSLPNLFLARKYKVLQLRHCHHSRPQRRLAIGRDLWYRLHVQPGRERMEPAAELRPDERSVD